LGGRGQASINPKAGTVEELQSRRKKLHMGMCKLLKEDLALNGEQRLADQQANADAKAIWDLILTEFESLTHKHEDVDTHVFNSDDAEYKRLMTEAIDGKAYALLKMDVYLESAARGFERAALNRIRDAPLADFAEPAVLLPLQTGITQFPWVAVVKDKSPEIDLGEWDAAPVSGDARELVSCALRDNINIRIVTIKGGKLVLNHGWATTELKWGSNAAVRALPATVALVLRNCTCLSNLDVRCLMQILYPSTHLSLPFIDSK
jgi:hypothetical protein